MGAPDQQSVVVLQQQPVPVLVQRSRRGLRLGFRGSTLVVATPTGQLDAQARAFIEAKAQWVLHHHRLLFGQDVLRARYRAVWNQQVLLHGRPRRLHTQVAQRREMRLDASGLLLRAPLHDLNTGRALVKAALRSYARHWLERRLHHWAAATGENVQQVRIKDLSSRWGSCSSQGNVNLSWYLVMLPTALADYVVVHELMHLREMNHSPAFWRHVARYVPDYRALRKTLVDHQWLIGIYDDPDPAA